MPKQLSLSIILIVHNQQDTIEETLTAIYNQISLPFELFILDDASRDESSSIIQSVVEYQQHENTFYYQYDEPAGRGVRLNEALSQVSGSIMWNPDVIQSLSKGVLEMAARKLYNEKYPFSLFHDQPLPDSEKEWLDFLLDGNWPLNDCFLWNLNVLPPSQCYFQPRLNRFQGIELAMRQGIGMEYLETDYFHADGSTRYYVSPDYSNRCELMFSFLQMHSTTMKRQAMSEIFSGFDTDDTEDKEAETDEITLNNKAKRLYEQGDTISAFNAINSALKHSPDDVELLQLKIDLLEKLRRYVEASELKYQLKSATAALQQADKEENRNSDTESSDDFEKTEDAVSDEEQAASASDKLDDKIEQDIEKLKDRGPALEVNEADKPLISIIIPTALDGKPFLEQCMVAIGEECNPDYTELIIIDNGSLDDTHDYLEQLSEEEFFGCQIITNSRNEGFAAAVNQGLERAEGDFACVMHNDVLIQNQAVDYMVAFMQRNEAYGVIGPTTNRTFWNEQEEGSRPDTDEDIVETSYLDSFCMIMRTDTGFSMDEQLSPAYLEDIDYCQQVKSEGYKVGIATHINVEHLQGITTEQLSLSPDGNRYWKNVRYFNDKWDTGPEFPAEYDDPVLAIAAVANIINPYYPEEHLLEQLRKLYDDKVEARLIKSTFEDPVLFGLIQTMMVMEERHVLRRLEDKLDQTNPPLFLIMRLTEFYHERSIYSRCRHYLNRIPDDQRNLEQWIYMLKIELGERNLDKATTLLTELMERYPAQVELLHAASELHAMQGNEKESKKFLNLARQAAPFMYNSDKEKSKNLT